MRVIRPGTGARTLQRRLRRELSIRVGRNYWYLARSRSVTLVYKARAGRVTAVGIANRRLTSGRRASRRFLTAWAL